MFNKVKGKLWFDKYGYIESSGGNVEIGFNNFFNQRFLPVYIVRISIGENNLFGPGGAIYDHGLCYRYHYIANVLK
jgi:acetyltransferase-like isoleucine patch superfamily enzyme